MPKFRKKPIVIEAFQMTKAASDERHKYPDWLVQAYKNGKAKDGQAFYRSANGMWLIETLEGTHIVSWNDWIIQGIMGELYPCKPDIFDATYELIT